MSYVNAVNINKYEIEFIEDCPEFLGGYLKDSIPDNMCPFLLHTLVPYYVTYFYGGDFTWSKERGHVDVQCPNPKARVVTETVNRGSISFVVKSTQGGCPMNYATGIKIDLSGIFKRLCPLIYDVSFPWIQLQISNPIILRCPGCPESKGIKFILRKTDENK